MTEREALTIFRTIQKCRHQALHTNDCGNCERCQHYHEQEQIDGAVALAISALEKQDRWIPVTERLPEDDTEVFVYLFDSKSPYIAWICDGRWYTEEFEVEKENEPVAWRPLPEPYKEEEDAQI